MARMKPTGDAKKPVAAKQLARPKPAAAAKDDASGRGFFSGEHSLARRRSKALAAAVAAAALIAAGKLVWERVEPTVVSRERYLLPATAITVNPPPEWIVCDVASQVIQTAGLDRRLSIMDDGFVKAIDNAFTLHPWVESVSRIEKSYPPAVKVELVYRRPIAVIETPLAGGVELLPVDAHGIHLPASDVPLIRRNYLPRIMGVVGQPPLGQRWDDPRVSGAVDLAARLADVWDSLHLAEIVPSARPEVQGEQRYFVYDLVTQGGTRIVWGAAPEAGAPGEADFVVKRQRLEQCGHQYGPFDSVKSPDVVDIRHGIQVTPRTVKKPGAEPRQAEKPEKPTEPRQAQALAEPRQAQKTDVETEDAAVVK